MKPRVEPEYCSPAWAVREILTLTRPLITLMGEQKRSYIQSLFLLASPLPASRIDPAVLMALLESVEAWIMDPNIAQCTPPFPPTVLVPCIPAPTAHLRRPLDWLTDFGIGPVPQMAKGGTFVCRLQNPALNALRYLTGCKAGRIGLQLAIYEVFHTPGLQILDETGFLWANLIVYCRRKSCGPSICNSGDAGHRGAIFDMAEAWLKRGKVAPAGWAS